MKPASSSDTLINARQMDSDNNIAFRRSSARDTLLQCICVLRRILVYAMLSKNLRNAVGQESGLKWKDSNKRLLSLWGLVTLHYCASRIHSTKTMGFILS